MARHSQYVPDFRVRINDQDLPAAVRASVTGVRYEDGMPSMPAGGEDDAPAADRVEVELANTDLRWLQSPIRGLGVRPYPTGVKVGPVRAYDAVSGGLFDLDNKLSLEMGYAPDPLQEMFVGEITGVEADFPAGGLPTLKLVAHDYLNRLSRGKYARGFGLLPDWLLAAILSAENLLFPFIDPVVGAASDATTILNSIFKGTGRKQKGQSDLELLKEIADQYDADFWVEGDTLYLSRVFGKEFSPRLTLTWGESLLSFTPRVSTVGQVVGVAVKFTLPVIPLDFVLTASWDFDRESLSVTVVPGATKAFVKSLAGPVLTLIDRHLHKIGRAHV